MRKISPLLILTLAVIVGLLCIFGDNSYGKLDSLRRSLLSQREKNVEVSAVVNDLHREVRNLHSNPRAVEKAARNELGMARPSDLVFFFDKADPNKATEVTPQGGVKTKKAE